MPKKRPQENEKPTKHRIGVLGEKSLHAKLKEWYSQPGDRFEKVIDNFHIDIVRDKFLIEIQTRSFSSIKRKLETLVKKFTVRLVLPIAREKWIVRIARNGTTQLGRRKSPKKGNIFHLFQELVSFPDLIKNRNFSIEVLFTLEEEIRRDDGLGSWRRKGWSIADRCLIEVTGNHIFERPSDFLALIPASVPDPFSTKDLAEITGIPRWLAQKMAYYLRKMRVIESVGKSGNSVLYSKHG
ncbi:MAG: hypothetical protein JRF72_06455 [Deltaproteobacteria bacterium]|nr:hypothetical protein [Deltaproteobacteria bacterium]